jgi:hypothetical protein
MMREVPRSEWNNFFSSFSLQYRGWLIGLEAHGPNGRTQFALRELPLCAVTANLKNTRQDSITSQSVQIRPNTSPTASTTPSASG